MLTLLTIGHAQAVGNGGPETAQASSTLSPALSNAAALCLGSPFFAFVSLKHRKWHPLTVAPLGLEPDDQEDKWSYLEVKRCG